MKHIDMTNVKESGEFINLTAGAYICVIRNVEDFEDREYLKVTYDIAEGEFKGYYDDLRSNHPDWSWSGAYVKSYKEKALPMFKRFCSAVSKSNGNFVFDGNTVNADERTLIGKRIGLVLGEEEYWSNSGDKRTRLYVSKEFPIDKIADQKIPNKRLLEDESSKSESISEFVNVPEGANSEIPF